MTSMDGFCEIPDIPEISDYILKAVVNGIVLTDADANILWANDAFTNLTGYELAEIKGQNSRILQSGYHNPKFYQTIWAKLVQNIPWRGELLNKRKNGTLYFEEMTITPTMIGGKKFYIAIKQDITTRKEVEKRVKNSEKNLQETTNKLLIINDSLKDFAYMASHDLKDPLRTVNSLLPIIIEKTKKGAVQEAVENMTLVASSIRNSLALIDNLLEWCKVDGRKIECQKVNARTLIDKALNNLRERIEETQKTKAINFTFQAEYPEIVCDPDLIVNVYQNLISNALKYSASESADIAFTCSLNVKKCYILGVKDNGIGIEEKFLKYVFFPLKRLHRQDEIPGTGIGLSICKKIIDRHNGKLWVSSKVGKGSHFKFTVGG